MSLQHSDELKGQIEQALRVRLTTAVGHGGFGIVYAAHDPSDKAEVHTAVKVSLDPLSSDGAKKELEALREFRCLNGLPHILSLHKADIVQGYLVSQWELAHGTLHDELENQATGIPIQTLLRYIEEAAIGLDQIHLNQLVHRDVKPKNLFLVHDHIKVGDFGLARFVGATSVHTQRNAGTKAYMAPEAKTSGHIHYLNDIYSLAVTYAHLRTGHLPFEGSDSEIESRQKANDPNVEGIDSSCEVEFLRRSLAHELDSRPYGQFEQGRAAVEWVEELKKAILRDCILSLSFGAYGLENKGQLRC